MCFLHVQSEPLKQPLRPVMAGGAFPCLFSLVQPAQKELGICIDTLCSWLKAFTEEKAGVVDRQNREARRIWELEAEIKSLRKQAAEKDDIIGILKNPWAYFQ